MTKKVSFLLFMHYSWKRVASSQVIIYNSVFSYLFVVYVPLKRGSCHVHIVWSTPDFLSVILLG